MLSWGFSALQLPWLHGEVRGDGNTGDPRRAPAVLRLQSVRLHANRAGRCQASSAPRGCPGVTQDVTPPSPLEMSHLG